MNKTSLHFRTNLLTNVLLKEYWGLFWLQKKVELHCCACYFTTTYILLQRGSVFKKNSPK
jgi:hypothetical protein